MCNWSIIMYLKDHIFPTALKWPFCCKSKGLMYMSLLSNIQVFNILLNSLSHAECKLIEIK